MVPNFAEAKDRSIIILRVLFYIRAKVKYLYSVDAMGIKCVSSLSLLSVLDLQRASLAATHSQQMLVLAPPSTLTVFNTSTYRPLVGGFPGLHLPKLQSELRNAPFEMVGGITRSSLSADGR